MTNTKTKKKDTKFNSDKRKQEEKKKVKNVFYKLENKKEGLKHRDKRLPNTNDLVQIRTESAIGLNTATIATGLGISKDTLEIWINEYDEVFAAIETGRAMCRKRAYACFYSQAFPIDENGRPTNKGDPSLMIFWMKTRCRWKEPPKDLIIHGSQEPPIIEFATREIKKDERKDKN